MSVDLELVDVVARLQGAVASAQLPAAARAQAKTMQDRLRNGVRIVLLGPQGGGKSDLCSLLLGADLPDPPTQVVARQFVRAEDTATPEVVEGAAGPFWRVGLPLDLLTHLQILDMAGSPDPVVQAARMRWAMGEADMVLWCGSDFDAADATLWAEAPETLKDHSFLVLTGADRLAEAGVLKTRIAALQETAAEEFHSLFPTTTKAARACLRQQGILPEAQAQASGVRALMDVIRKLAAQGRQADLDCAQLFLQRHGIEAVVQAQAPAAPAVQSGPYGKALELIRARSASLDMAPDGIAAEVEPFLAWCGALSEDLQHLASDENAPCADFHAWREDLYAAGDKLVLMSMENDLRSAADAASILLQINRELLARTGP